MSVDAFALATRHSDNANAQSFACAHQGEEVVMAFANQVLQ